MRNLYLQTVPIDEALEKYTQALIPVIKRQQEQVAVAKALGCVTSEAVYALYNSPLYDCAAMDGIAVISAQTGGAREGAPLFIMEGKDYQIVDTGDPVHPPYDAVIMAEDVHFEGQGAHIRAAASPWQHIRPVGEDIVAGEMILPGSHTIRPIDVGVLLSGGVTEVTVWKKPVVSIIPTGSEIIEPGDPIHDGAIIESNSRMFEGMVMQNGGIAKRFQTVPDDKDAIKNTIEQALEESDFVLINAGSSAGTEDYTVHVLRELGEVLIHGVAMKPGKPTVLAIVNNKPVIGLPGYPVSAWLAYEQFAGPVLAMLSGQIRKKENIVKAVLSKRLVSSLKYQEYVRVKVGKVDQRIVATPLSRGAGSAMSLVRADGFCVIDRDSEGAEAGSEVDVSLFRDLAELDSTVVSIGSHDLILDVLADLLPNLYQNTHLSSTHIGSMGGLLALKRGEAHLSPIHLLDEGTGQYNIGILKKMFPDEPFALIKGVGRQQGIMTQAGNPLGVQNITDLTRGKYINRQRGAGTRVLLDYKLKELGINPADIIGYNREAATHMAVAAAVKSGSADMGLGILSAAKQMELDFIHVGDEDYDFAIPQKFLKLPHVQAFIAALQSKEFEQRLLELGGYTYCRIGEVVLL